MLVGPRPAEAHGDLVTLMRKTIERRGRDTVRVTKVKGHADENMV